MTQLRQRHYRFRTDSGTADDTPTWGASEDTAFDPAGANFRLRVGLSNADAAATGSIPWEIYVSKNGGAYSAITPTSTGGAISADAGSSADETPILVPRLTGLLGPAWVLEAETSIASFDLDFADGRYYGGTVTDLLSCSRASDGWAQNLAGTWIQFSSNQLRITDRGLLVEGARTNYLINSDTPATQTTASLDTGTYILWVNGTGSALASGGTATVTGASPATDGSPDTFNVTVAGTVTITVTGTLTRFQLELGTFASSYIPTGATSAARATDQVTFAGDLDTLVRASIRTSVIDLLLADVADLYVIMGGNSGGSELYLSSSNTDLVSALPSTILDLDFSGGGRGYKSGIKIAAAINGTARSIDAGGIVPASDSGGGNLTGVRVGLGSQGGANTIFGYIRRATFWNSKLSDATLQTLTAP